MASKGPDNKTRRPLFVAASLFVLLAASLIAGIAFGVSQLSPMTALRLLVAPDGSPENALVWDIRLPRVLLAALVGANLAVAGVLIQTLTRNPLASPQTFGINAGASLAIVVCLIAFPALREQAQYGRPLWALPSWALRCGRSRYPGQ